jgi:hypothetical protein
MIEMHGTVKNLPLLSCALADVNGQKRCVERVIKNATHRSNSPVSGKWMSMGSIAQYRTMSDMLVARR